MKVLLAQTRKPPTETRFWDKIRLSLKNGGFTEIKVLGSGPTQLIKERTDEAIPIFTTGGLFSVGVNIWRFYCYLNKFWPDVIIVSSLELWPLAAFYQWHKNAKLIIDLQENHSLNIEEQMVYKGTKKRLLSWMASFLEINFLPLAKKIWFAENVYSQQFTTLLYKSRVFENKVPVWWTTKEKKESLPGMELRIAFTGVLSEEAGLFASLDFIKRFRIHYPFASLVVLGSFSSEKTHQKFLHLTNGLNFVETSAENIWQSSEAIHQVLQTCQAILAPYRYSRANSGKFPTKFFEAFYLGMPVLLPKGNPFSAEAQIPALIEVDFENMDREEVEKIIHEINVRQQRFTAGNMAYKWDEGTFYKDFSSFLAAFPGKQL